MDLDTDDKFFIDEPQNLGSNFFNRDKSIRILELLANKNHPDQGSKLPRKQSHLEPSSIRFKMKKPELKSRPADNITPLLEKVQHTGQNLDSKTLDRLSAVIDHHFIELVKTDEYDDVIEDLNAHIESHSNLLDAIESTKYMLRPITDHMANTKTETHKHRTRTDRKQNILIYHNVDFIRF